MRHLGIRVPVAAALCAFILACLMIPAAAGDEARDSVPPPVVKRSWYFAEGTTGYGFEEYVCVQNPTSQNATVQATYMMAPELGSLAGEPFLLAPFSRATINVGGILPGVDVSVRVDSDKGIICERAMYWAGRLEGHESIGVMAPSNVWYLPEGCTDYGFEEWVSIQNPEAAGATVNIIYNTRAGPVARAPLQVAPHARETVFVNADVPAQDVSVTVNATGPVVAERAMYWDGRRGGHSSIGVPSASPQWFLAEGSTKWGFDAFVLVQNPGAADATVNMTFLVAGGGAVAAPPLLVKAASRQTVDPRPVVGNADFSTSVTADRPITCERSMYWNNGTGKAGHDTIGVTAARYNCFLAEGTTAYGFETFLLIANPNNAENDVQVMYMTPQGIEVRPGVIVPPHSRTTINVNAVVPGRDVSMQVQGNLPIVAERAMYWNGRGGGHDSVGYLSDTVGTK